MCPTFSKKMKFKILQNCFSKKVITNIVHSFGNFEIECVVIVAGSYEMPKCVLRFVNVVKSECFIIALRIQKYRKRASVWAILKFRLLFLAFGNPIVFPM